jgi:ketosteroid isomerase-like protein
MTNATALKSKGGDADELERMIHAWTQAVHARDADAAVADYADDVRNFDLAPPLQHSGRNTIRDNLQGWFATFSGPVGSELRDLKIETGGDVAFAHGFNASMASAPTAAKPACGFASPSAFARSAAPGRSRTSTRRCRSTWTARSKRRST